MTQGNSDKTLKVRAEMSPDLEMMLTYFLQNNTYIFSCEGEPMPRIPHKYALYHLSMEHKNEASEKEKTVIWSRKK